MAHGSSLGAAPRYTISQTVETFALPTGPIPDAVALDYEQARARAMAARGEGLTRLWQRLQDPAERAADIVAWREAQVALDLAVAEAYGWSRPPVHGFYELRGQARFTISPADQARVLA